VLSSLSYLACLPYLEQQPAKMQALKAIWQPNGQAKVCGRSCRTQLLSQPCLTGRALQSQSTVGCFMMFTLQLPVPVPMWLLPSNRLYNKQPKAWSRPTTCTPGCPYEDLSSPDNQLSPSRSHPEAALVAAWH
jgi:hypothetical protein